jgi:hypothetical protein
MMTMVMIMVMTTTMMMMAMVMMIVLFRKVCGPSTALPWISWRASGKEEAR